MSQWKPIDQNEIISDSLVVHRTFNLDQSSIGQKFIQFIILKMI